MQVHEAISVRKRKEVHTGKKAMLMKKIRNASLKKLYESKISALADHNMSPHLLRIMCQDTPMAKENLNSRRERNSFVKRCLRYYQGQLREIERSERTGFFGLFSF